MRDGFATRRICPGADHFNGSHSVVVRIWSLVAIFRHVGVFFDMLAFRWTWYPPPFLKLNGLHTRGGPAFGIGRAL